eukprot:6198826-Pleurochrysis_carterae.AAC.2
MQGNSQHFSCRRPCEQREVSMCWPQVDSTHVAFRICCSFVSFVRFIRELDGAILLNEELHENFEQGYTTTSTSHGTHKFHAMEFGQFIVSASRVCMPPAVYFERRSVAANRFNRESACTAWQPSPRPVCSHVTCA